MCPMYLGHYSLSLSVKDIAASLRFYQNLGFDIFYIMDTVYTDTEWIPSTPTQTMQNGEFDKRTIT